jgi:hypothetical protein
MAKLQNHDIDETDFDQYSKQRLSEYYYVLYLANIVKQLGASNLKKIELNDFEVDTGLDGLPNLSQMFKYACNSSSRRQEEIEILNTLLDLKEILSCRIKVHMTLIRRNCASSELIRAVSSSHNSKSPPIRQSWGQLLVGDSKAILSDFQGIYSIFLCIVILERLLMYVYTYGCMYDK